MNWMPNRPYLGGTKYNCLEYELIATPTTKSTSDVKEKKIFIFNYPYVKRSGFVSVPKDLSNR